MSLTNRVEQFLKQAKEKQEKQEVEPSIKAGESDSFVEFELSLGALSVGSQNKFAPEKNAESIASKEHMPILDEEKIQAICSEKASGGFLITKEDEDLGESFFCKDGIKIPEAPNKKI
eukprot:GHVP01068696.1.p1 GENE.GHVP01068696.1~~GHVP01068696.1.p1  ORF type:complete len:118 (-),score=32.51 GHVP01068696.1:85-438(-)